MDDQHEADDKDEDLDFRSLLEHAPDAFVLVGACGDIQYVNSQGEMLFGYHRDEILGKSVEILIPERYREVHKLHRATYALTPRARAAGLHMDHLAGRRKDGSEFLADITLAPLPDGVTAAAIRKRGRGREWERELERERERERGRERELEREHERAQGRARARKLQSISIPTAIAIVVIAQIVLNLILYHFFGRP